MFKMVKCTLYKAAKNRFCLISLICLGLSSKEATRAVSTKHVARRLHSQIPVSFLRKAVAHLLYTVVPFMFPPFPCNVNARPPSDMCKNVIVCSQMLGVHD